jgi:hypothetical protein
MFVSDQAIPCPVCAEEGKDVQIKFETKQLLLGVRFACPECNAEIGLSPESVPAVEHALNEVEKFKMGSHE